jgi:glycyl-tRNA synthetase
MFQTNVGAMTDGSSVAYLRPETAQGMFVDFKNVVDTGRVKLPFGIAQIGKSFRNEITPRNFIFRSREFEQMEMEYFIHEDADWAKCHEEWIAWCKNWLLSIGLPESHLSLYAHPKEKLAFYSRGTVDIMFKYPFGVQELWGIAARGSYDLTQHANASGKPQEIFDETTKKKFVPHVIEPAVGTDRIFLAVLCSAYAEEQVTDEKGNTETRTVLSLSPRIAPVRRRSRCLAPPAAAAMLIRADSNQSAPLPGPARPRKGAERLGHALVKKDRAVEELEASQAVRPRVG